MTGATEQVFRSDPKPEAVEAARLFSERILRDWNLADVEERATAIITELVANVVEHARTDLELRLSHDGCIRIEVDDQDPAPAVLLSPEPLEEGGRGMFIVALYATDWGISPTANGKTVWARIDLAPATPSPANAPGLSSTP